MDQKILITVLVIVSITVSIAIVLGIMKRVRSTHKKSISQLPGELKELKSGKTISAEHDGIAYEVYYFAGGKNAPPHLAIRVACESEGRFKLTKESGFDRFFKRYGITNEIQILDKAFDDAYFIQSETVDFVRQFFQPPEKRRATHELFELQYTVVEHDGKTMKVVCSPFRLQNERPPDFVTGAVTRLADSRSPILAAGPADRETRGLFPDPSTRRPQSDADLYRDETRTLRLRVEGLVPGNRVTGTQQPAIVANLLVCSTQNHRPLARSRRAAPSRLTAS